MQFSANFGQIIGSPPSGKFWVCRWNPMAFWFRTPRGHVSELVVTTTRRMPIHLSFPGVSSIIVPGISTWTIKPSDWHSIYYEQCNQNIFVTFNYLDETGYRNHLQQHWWKHPEHTCYLSVFTVQLPFYSRNDLIFFKNPINVEKTVCSIMWIFRKLLMKLAQHMG